MATRLHHGSYRQRGELTRERYMQAWHKVVETPTCRTFPTVLSRRTTCRRLLTSTTCSRVCRGLSPSDQNASIVVIVRDDRRASHESDTSAKGKSGGAIVRRPGSYRRMTKIYACRPRPVKRRRRPRSARWPASLRSRKNLDDR